MSIQRLLLISIGILLITLHRTDSVKIKNTLSTPYDVLISNEVDDETMTKVHQMNSLFDDINNVQEERDMFDTSLIEQTPEASEEDYEKVDSTWKGNSPPATAGLCEGSNDADYGADDGADKCDNTAEPAKDMIDQRIVQQQQALQALRTNTINQTQTNNPMLLEIDQETPPSQTLEDEMTVLGNLVPQVPENSGILPIAVVTDGDTTYPISTAKLGPELMTKVGLRVEIKGAPVETEDGDMIIQVSGYKILGPARGD